MLVLTRKENERIQIGDEIEIQVVSVKGGRVKLAFSAPAEIPIHREECLSEFRDQFADHREEALELAAH